MKFYTCNGHRLRFQSKGAEHGAAALDVLGAWRGARSSGRLALDSLLFIAEFLTLGRWKKSQIMAVASIYTCNGHGLRFQSKPRENGSSALDDAGSGAHGVGRVAAAVWRLTAYFLRRALDAWPLEKSQIVAVIIRVVDKAFQAILDHFFAFDAEMLPAIDRSI